MAALAASRKLHIPVHSSTIDEEVSRQRAAIQCIPVQCVRWGSIRQPSAISVGAGCGAVRSGHRRTRETVFAIRTAAEVRSGEEAHEYA